MTLQTTGEEAALWRLSTGYAFGLDTGDGDLFCNVFMSDGRLSIAFLESSDPPSETKGHADLRRIPAKLGSYAKTLHLLGQSDYQITDDTARGVVYCLAHHHSVSERGGLDHVMHMSYQDIYARDEVGSWKIRSRTGFVHWTETRPTDPFRS